MLLNFFQRFLQAFIWIYYFWENKQRFKNCFCINVLKTLPTLLKFRIRLNLRHEFQQSKIAITSSSYCLWIAFSCISSRSLSDCTDVGTSITVIWYRILLTNCTTSMDNMGYLKGYYQAGRC